MATPTSLILYHYELCPYARRCRITLLEKDLEHQLVPIDLSNKPANFLAISPYGKVPVLVDEDATIYESNIINEYLEERFWNIGECLLPDQAQDRAKVREWMAFCDDYLMGPTYRLQRALQEPVTKQDSQALEALQDDLLKYVAFLEKALEKSPYLAGPFFSLADIACMPILERIEMVGTRLDQYPEIKAWIARLKSRPSYQTVVT